MRTDQIHQTQWMGWLDLAVVCLWAKPKHRPDDRVFAVPHLPGRVERFRTFTQMGLAPDNMALLPTLSTDPYPTSHHHRRW
jgi:hypothetical protein